MVPEICIIALPVRRKAVAHRTEKSLKNFKEFPRLLLAFLLAGGNPPDRPDTLRYASSFAPCLLNF